MTSASMKEAITGAMRALGALTMPSHVPAQGPEFPSGIGLG